MINTKTSWAGSFNFASDFFSCSSTGLEADKKIPNLLLVPPVYGLLSGSRVPVMVPVTPVTIWLGF